MFGVNRRIVVGELETTPGTAQFDLSSTFPASASHNNRITNIEFKTSIAMDDEVGDVRLGDDAELWSVSGIRSGEISFTIPCTWGGTVTDKGHWIDYAKACGLDSTVYATTKGLGVHNDSTYNCRSMTIAVFDIGCGVAPDVRGYLFKGCVGDWELSASAVGAPWKWKFSFKGAYVGDYAIDFANVPVFTNPSEKVPEKLLASTIYVQSVKMFVNSFNVVGGNDVKMIPNQEDTTGIKQYYIAGRKTRLQMQALVQKIATEDPFTKITTEATAAASITGTNMKIDFPRVQYLTSEQAEIEGLAAYSHNFKLLRNNTGYTTGKEIAALSDGAVFEILQGTRS